MSLTTLVPRPTTVYESYTRITAKHLQKIIRILLNHIDKSICFVSPDRFHIKFILFFSNLKIEILNS